MPDFKPIFLPEGRELNGKMSMTFARHFNQCPRSAYLGRALQAGEGNATGVELVRGSALHEILERCTQEARHLGEDYIPGDVAKTLADEVLSDPRFPVPLEEHDYIRESVYRWAAHTSLQGPFAAVETPFLLEVEGMVLRMRIDRADVSEFDGAITIRDYKSSRWAISQEDFARKRPDGEFAVKSFQHVVYALGMKYGRQAYIEPDGTWVPGLTTPSQGRASSTDHFDLILEYPGIPDDDGAPLQRKASLTGVELEEYMESLRTLVRRVKHAEAEGDWPAVVSDAACAECPATSLCPIPHELRDHRGVINTEEQAAEAMMVLDTMGTVHRSVREEVKRFVKATGLDVQGLRYGGKVFGPQPTTRRKTDAEGMAAAAAEAVRTGEPFDPAAFVKVSTGTDWRSKDWVPADPPDEGDIPF